MRCPKCDRPLIAVGKFLVCEEHGQLPEPLVNACHGPADTGVNPILREAEAAYGVSHLPCIIAVPIAEYFLEANPYIQLHRLSHCMEIITRFSTGILLHDILRQQNEFPREIKNSLSENIEHPSFGAWKNLLYLSTKTIAPDHSFVKELPAFSRDIDSFLTEIIKIRNLVVHNGRVDDSVCHEYLAQLEPRFTMALKKITFFSRYMLAGVESEKIMHDLTGYMEALHGTPEITSIFTNRPVECGRIYLIDRHSHDFLSLFPMSAFCQIFQWTDQGMTNTGILSPMLYLRKSNKKYVEYTTFVTKPLHSQDAEKSFREFQDVYKIEEWRQLNSQKNAMGRFSFRELTDSLLECFVGRDKERTRIHEWTRHSQQGFLWIAGKPGIGKSALLARIHKDLEGGVKEQGLIFLPYYFRASNQSLCNRASFLEAAILVLRNGLGIADPSQTDSDKLELQFTILLHKASRHFDGIAKGKVIFLLDSMDEIYGMDRDFPSWLLSIRLPNVLWVCTGRDDPALVQLFSNDKCDWLIASEGGLPPLSSNEIRSILLEECDHIALGLLRRDIAGKDGGWTNPFIEALIKNSEGLPLYVKLLVEDIREGRYDFTDEKRLPDGLRSYYEEILDRLGVSDAKFLMTPMLCLLALAREPLTAGLIEALLKPVCPLRTGEFVQDTLAHGHIMLKRAASGTGMPGYSLYHESFRQYILSSDRAHKMVETTRLYLAGFCSGYRNHDTDEECLRYALRYGVSHLLEAGQWTAAVGMLSQLYKTENYWSKLPTGYLYGLLEKLAISLDRCPKDDASRIDPYEVAELLPRLEDLEPLYNAVSFLHTNFQAKWKELVTVMIASNCWVLNYSISRILADRYLVAKDERQFGEIIRMAESENIDEQETGLLAVKNIFATDPSNIDMRFLRKNLSDMFVAGGSTGELLLLLALNKVKISPIIVDTPFSNPLWDYNRALLMDILAGEYLSQNGIVVSPPLAKDVLSSYFLSANTETMRQTLLNSEDVRKEPTLMCLLHEYYRLPLNLSLFRPSELALRRSPLFKELLRVFFASPFWEVREQASYIFNTIVQCNMEQLGIIRDFIIDPNWHIRYTALEAAADVWAVDDYAIFTDATKRCCKDEHPWVRGLCADHIAWYVSMGIEKRMERIALFSNEIAGLLQDKDIWVLDRLHSLFYKIYEMGDPVEELLSEYDKVSMLLARNQGWYKQERTAFLKTTEALKRSDMYN